MTPLEWGVAGAAFLVVGGLATSLASRWFDADLPW